MLFSTNIELARSHSRTNIRGKNRNSVKHMLAIFYLVYFSLGVKRGELKRGFLLYKSLRNFQFNFLNQDKAIQLALGLNSWF